MIISIFFEDKQFVTLPVIFSENIFSRDLFKNSILSLNRVLTIWSWLNFFNSFFNKPFPILLLYISFILLLIKSNNSFIINLLLLFRRLSVARLSCILLLLLLLFFLLFPSNNVVLLSDFLISIFFVKFYEIRILSSLFETIILLDLLDKLVKLSVGLSLFNTNIDNSFLFSCLFSILFTGK